MELLDQVEMATHRRISRPGGSAGADRLRLQTALELDGDGWQDALGAMLWTRDLVLVQRSAAGDHEALPIPSGDAAWIAETAQDCTLASLFGRRPFGPVCVELPGTLVVDEVRTFVDSTCHSRPRPCQVAAAQNGRVAIAGLGDDVRFALEPLAMVGCLDLAPHRPVAAPWPRDGGERRFELRRGQQSARELIDLLARRLGRNVLTGPGADCLDAPIGIDATRTLDALQLEEAITRLLWDAGILLVELEPQHGLYQAVQVTKHWQVTQAVATPMSAAELLARKDLVALVCVTVRPRHLSQQAANALAEPDVGKLLRSGVEAQVYRVSTSEALHMIGLTLAVAPVLVELAQKDVAPTAAKR